MAPEDHNGYQCSGRQQPTASNLTPYLCMNYIICVEGIYPGEKLTIKNQHQKKTLWKE